MTDSVQDIKLHYIHVDIKEFMLPQFEKVELEASPSQQPVSDPIICKSHPLCPSFRFSVLCVFCKPQLRDDNHEGGIIPHLNRGARYHCEYEMRLQS